jgi:hypothetical protein
VAGGGVVGVSARGRARLRGRDNELQPQKHDEALDPDICDLGARKVRARGLLDHDGAEAEEKRAVGALCNGVGWELGRAFWARTGSLAAGCARTPLPRNTLTH